jgi:hypothetical protein
MKTNNLGCFHEFGKKKTKKDKIPFGHHFEFDKIIEIHI